MSNSITHAAIEPRDEGSSVGIAACGEEPEPGGEMRMNKTKQRKHLNLSTNQMLWRAFKSPYPEV